MSRKIVAIGGGENGRLKPNGTRYPFETAPFDKEIIRLTGKAKPNFLLIAHSQKPEGEQRYFETMKYIYQAMYGCEVKNLFARDLENPALVNELTEWADIIYEGGGDTDTMIKLWKRTGFDKILCNAWLSGKVMCGVSAGAMCWFNSGASDSLKIQLGDSSADFIDVECLNFINAYYTPHCDEKGRLEAVKQLTKNKEIVALSVSNCAAIEIVDNELTVLKSHSRADFEPYILKSYWQNGEYIQEYLDKKSYNLNEALGK